MWQTANGMMVGPQKQSCKELKTESHCGMGTSPGPVFMSVGITYDGHISKPGITELKVGSSENWYSRVR